MTASPCTVQRARWSDNLWVRLQSVGFIMFLAVLMGGLAMLFVPLLHRRHALQQELARLDKAIAQEEFREKQLRMEIDALKTDPVFVERVARQKLNLVRPHEMLFRFEPPPPNGAHGR